MVNILCFVENVTSQIDLFIKQYDDEEHIIQLYDNIVTSSEGDLFFCIGEIATQMIQAQGEVWFVTDHKEVYDIVSEYYGMLVSKMQYFETENTAFAKPVSWRELLQYESELVLNQEGKAILDLLLNLMGNENYALLWNASIDFGNYFMKGQDAIITKLWAHWFRVLRSLFATEVTSDSKVSCFYDLILLEMLAYLEKNPAFTNLYLEKILERQDFDLEEYYHVWNQMKAYLLKKLLVSDKATNPLLDALYLRTYEGYKQALEDELKPIPKDRRNPNRVVVFAIQFLGENHAPTKTVTERCISLCKMEREVLLVNTREQYTDKGKFPNPLMLLGNVADCYNGRNRLNLDADTHVQMYQPEVSMPDLEEMRRIFAMLQEYRPMYIISVGNGSLVADLCDAMVPVFPMALAFSTLPKSMCKNGIIGRTLTGEERKMFEQSGKNIIESRFTFQLKPQKNTFARKEYHLPEDRKLILVTGIRLDFEIKEDFIEAMEEVLKAGGHLVFAGIFDSYPKWCERFPFLQSHSTFIGYCEDMLALTEMVDLYVNPARLGGGFSVIEAFAKGKPGAYLAVGDVFVAGGEEFAVQTYRELTQTMIRYMSDSKFYDEMSKKAVKRAELMTDSVSAMREMEDKILDSLTQGE